MLQSVSPLISLLQYFHRLILAILILIFGVLFISRIIGLRKNRMQPLWHDRRLKIYATTLGCLFLFVVVLAIGTNNHESRSYHMRWSYGPPSDEWPEAAHIILEHVDYPGHYQGMYSPDLGPQLEAMHTSVLPVTFDVISDFGKVRGYTETTIGNTSSWRSHFGYSGSNTTGSPSPWD